MADLLPREVAAYHSSSNQSMRIHEAQMGRSTGASNHPTTVPPQRRPSHSHLQAGLDRSAHSAELPQSHCMTTFNSHLFSGPSNKQQSDNFSDHEATKSAYSDYVGTRRRSVRNVSPHEDAPHTKTPTTQSQTIDSEHTLPHSTEESLESRIQKLLRLNNPSEASSAKLCGTDSATSHVGGLSGAPVCSDSKCSPSISHLHQNGPHPALNHVASSEDLGENVKDPSTPSQFFDRNSQPINRKTLLPTPEIGNQRWVDDCKVLSGHNRPPLLKTPAKPVDRAEINRITSEVLDLFLMELKDIVDRDITRRVVEGNAFKIFSDWWDFEDDCTKVRMLRAYTRISVRWVSS